jgi:hypothetical protein
MLGGQIRTSRHGAAIESGQTGLFLSMLRHALS